MENLRGRERRRKECLWKEYRDGGFHIRSILRIKYSIFLLCGIDKTEYFVETLFCVFLILSKTDRKIDVSFYWFYYQCAIFSWDVPWQIHDRWCILEFTWSSYFDNLWKVSVEIITRFRFLWKYGVTDHDFLNRIFLDGMTVWITYHIIIMKIIFSSQLNDQNFRIVIFSSTLRILW